MYGSSENIYHETSGISKVMLGTTNLGRSMAMRVNARIDSLTDFHLQWKFEYKSGFIGNNYKKVVYLGKEVYDTPACSLV